MKLLKYLRKRNFFYDEFPSFLFIPGDWREDLVSIWCFYWGVSEDLIYSALNMLSFDIDLGSNYWLFSFNISSTVFFFIQNAIQFSVRHFADSFIFYLPSPRRAGALTIIFLWLDSSSTSPFFKNIISSFLFTAENK